MIVITINIYTQGELLNRYNFLYDHGVESAAAIITLFAFVFTFYNVLKNSKKDRENEKKKSRKTLIMIDLITNNYRENFKDVLNVIESFEGINIVPLNADGIAMHQVNFEEGNSPLSNFPVFETPFYTSYVVFSKYNYLKSDIVKGVIDNYDIEIKNQVSNHHLNLNNDSLDRITKRLKALKILNEKINELDLRILMLFELSNRYNILNGNKSLEDEHKQKLSNITDKIEEICNLIKDAKKTIS